MISGDRLVPAFFPFADTPPLKRQFLLADIQTAGCNSLPPIERVLVLHSAPTVGAADEQSLGGNSS
jgi:hypothetical protein